MGLELAAAELEEKWLKGEICFCGGEGSLELGLGRAWVAGIGLSGEQDSSTSAEELPCTPAWLCMFEREGVDLADS